VKAIAGEAVKSCTEVASSSLLYFFLSAKKLPSLYDIFDIEIAVLFYTLFAKHQQEFTIN